MSTILSRAAAVFAFAFLLPAAHAQINVYAHITADNHYSLYTSTGSVFDYHGGNEIDAAGSPGTYNWSVAESYQFPVSDRIYIAAWSDDAVAQGVLAEFQLNLQESILSGDLSWEVYGTNINRGDGDPHPSAAEIAGHVAFADANTLWQSPFFGGNNGVQPWGTIANIPAAAQWMWQSVPGDPDPLNGGSGAAEMLIFRTRGGAIPTPGVSAVLGAAACVALRRRRK